MAVRILEAYRGDGPGDDPLCRVGSWISDNRPVEWTRDGRAPLGSTPDEKGEGENDGE